MTDGLLPLMKELFESLAIALLAADTPEDRRTLFEPVHRAIVILDDYLCDLFQFSRKPRGKYAKKEKQNGES